MVADERDFASLFLLGRVGQQTERILQIGFEEIILLFEFFLAKLSLEFRPVQFILFKVHPPISREGSKRTWLGLSSRTWRGVFFLTWILNVVIVECFTTNYMRIRQCFSFLTLRKHSAVKMTRLNSTKMRQQRITWPESPNNCKRWVKLFQWDPWELLTCIFGIATFMSSFWTWSTSWQQRVYGTKISKTAVGQILK